ncbi:MAG: AMP-binding protein [Rhodospirillaceae bacterium]|nr:AMP-binding protein [Rhodospirillaceae bacterium]MBT5914671.1 AMP-binding protein [Rhodospirillaceae bacterium]MBT7731156.1 AMP-binding protein [Rhodospirillaceae bacterium]MDC0999124.1 AMP-binding protein [Alphaproteobacteria bacterium]
MLYQSYVHGVSKKPLLGETLGANFDAAVEKWGDQDALIVRHQNIRWTYLELQNKVNAFAAGLVSLGLQPGDRVGIWSPNNSEWVVTQYATAKAGIILVNINPAYRIAELEYAINKVGCKALILAESFKSSNYVAMVEELVPEISKSKSGEINSARLPTLKAVIQIGGETNDGYFDFEQIPTLASTKDHQQIESLSDQLQFDDPINIQFTSGTTGFPKGATLTHFNVLNNGYFTGEGLKLSSNDKLCVPVPLYHCFGMVLSNVAALTHGTALVYPAEAFDPLTVLESIEAERCTALHGVPTMFIAELGHPRFKEFDLSSLRTGIMAGSPCPIEVMRRVVEEMHCNEMIIAYGMTETSPIITLSETDDPMEKQVTTVGRIFPHVEVKIVDDTGRIVAPGETGELLARGYNVMQGYWDDPELTADSIDVAGWMHTGDLATMDVEGFCNIVGRVKDMVIRGGENIYPREIEEYLYRYIKINDVQVFGVPDVKFVEELCAWIILKPGETATEDDIRGFCQGQIAHYKIPRYIRFVDAFPMTITGKVQKFAMRDAMIEELGIDQVKTA